MPVLAGISLTVQSGLPRCSCLLTARDHRIYALCVGGHSREGGLEGSSVLLLDVSLSLCCGKENSICRGFNLWTLFDPLVLSICRVERWTGCRGWSGQGAVPCSLRHLELSMEAEILPDSVWWFAPVMRQLLKTAPVFKQNHASVGYCGGRRPL